jgi:hypothetical protein
MALLHDLLTAFLPLLTRKILAEERQAVALEAIDQKLGWLCEMDPDLQAFLHPEVADPDAAASAVEVSSPAEREVTAEQIEAFKALIWQNEGVLLDDEAAVERFEREFQAAIDRRMAAQEQRPGQAGGVEGPVRH